MYSPTDYLSNDRVGPLWSAIAAYGVGGVGLLAPFVHAALMMLRNRRRAAAARAAMSAGNQRFAPAGGEGVVCGVVEDDGRGAPVVAVVIRQQGKEWRQKGKWAHSWKEVSRKVSSRPFVVRMDSGDRVRVEPGERVVLVDQLDRGGRDGPNQRSRVAELFAGERVWVMGQFSRDVAGGTGGGGDPAGKRPTVRATPPREGGRMLLSAEPPDARHGRRARYYAVWALVLLGAPAAVQGLLFLSFNQRNLLGRTVEATVTNKQHHTTQHRGRRGRTTIRHHYEIRAAYADPAPGGPQRVLEDETSSEMFDRLAVGSSVPFVVAKGPPEASYNIGPAAAASKGPVIATYIGVGALWVIYVMSVRGSRPWYDRPKLHESGSGRLDESEPKVLK